MPWNYKKPHIDQVKLGFNFRGCTQLHTFDIGTATSERLGIQSRGSGLDLSGG
jgi:hypothetical protein